MDSRTRKRHEARFQALAHLIAGHHGVLQGEDYADILREGIGAALTLGLPLVARQQARRQRQASEAVPMPMPTESKKNPFDPYPMKTRPWTCDWPTPPVIFSDADWPVEGEPWGIGRGLPAGDVQ